MKTQIALPNLRNLVTDVSAASLGRVAVLMGGRSAERAVSLMSGQGVLQALQGVGVDAFAFDPAERPLGDLLTLQTDRCFIALHGRYGEDGSMQGALEWLNLPYTGPGVMASSMAMDKGITKQLWHHAGIPTPQSRLVTCADETLLAYQALGSPMIVKPVREGSTIGLTKVTSEAMCITAYERAAQQDHQVMCEAFVEGDEVTVPVIEFDTTQPYAVALPIIRICAPDGNYDYENKYHRDETKYFIPSGLPLHEEEAIQTWVMKAFATLQCRGWARVDVMIDKHRQPWLLEINTSPGMTSHSLVPMSAQAAGLDYTTLCVHLLNMARCDHASTTPPQ